MKNDEFRKRIARLVELARRLSIEADRERKGNLPLHIPERRQYVDSLHAAVRALEEARIALVKAQQRIQDEAKSRGGSG